jgi:hypothetical protein
MVKKKQTFNQYFRAFSKSENKTRPILDQKIVKEKGLVFAENLDRYSGIQADQGATLNIHRIIQYKTKARERFEGEEWRSVRLELMKAWRRHMESEKETSK